MFDSFALTFFVAVAALIVAIRALNQVAALRARLEALEASPRAAAAPVVPPPIPTDEFPIAPPIAIAETATGMREASPPVQPEPTPQAATEMPAPPPLPQAQPGFEERLGTRWVVWVGGLTLALGGFFMVRYSIEAGLLGPGVRTMLGGLFALALLAAGEWTRRKESISTIDALPIANIPAILTAAGTAVAFATVYAAYALYDFLAPATAFVLLGLVALGTLAAALLHGPALAGLGIVGAFVTPVLVSSEKPDFWALYIYLAIVTAAAFGLARVRLWRWLAVTTIAFALLWTFPGLRPDVDRTARVPRHRRLHPRGAARRLRLHVRPWRRRGSDRADLVRLARRLSVRRDHDRADRFPCRSCDDRVCAAGGRHPVRRLARRSRDCRGRHCRRLRLHRVRRMGDPRQPGNAGAAGRTVARHRTGRHRRVGLAAPHHRGDLCGRFRHHRISGAGPLEQPADSGHLVGHVRLHAAGAAGGALRTDRASRPLDPVCDSRRPARRRVRRRNRNPEQARGPAGPAGLDRPVCDRHARRAGAGADLCAGKGLAHDCACADVARHRLDLAAAADPVPAHAGGDPRRHRRAAHRLRAAHRRPRGRHHADLQLAVVGLWRAGAVVLGRQPSSCAATATTRRCVRWRPPQSCSRCCWRSWRSAISSTMATSIARAPGSPRSRCRSASRSRWRSGWNGCVCARAASCTTPAPSC